MMEQNIYGNISAGECNFGTDPNDQEMEVKLDPENKAARKTPQRGDQRIRHCCIYISIIICVVVLIAVMCACTIMYSQSNAGIQDIDAKISAFKAEGKNVTSKMEEQINILRILQQLVERMNSQEANNKAMVLQKIQNVGENIKSTFQEQINKLKNLGQFGFEEISGWKRFGSKFYYFSQVIKPWDTAREQCVAMGATLAMPKTKEEMEFIHKPGTNYWLGLNDISTEGTWKWLDGTSPASGLWASGEPNNRGEEDCGEISEKGNGKLNDGPCNMGKPWICEKSLAL